MAHWDCLGLLLVNKSLKELRCGVLAGVTQREFIEVASKSGLQVLSCTLINDASETGNKWDLDELRRKLPLIWFDEVRIL